VHGDTPKPPGVSETALTDTNLSQLREDFLAAIRYAPTKDEEEMVVDALERTVQAYADQEVKAYRRFIQEEYNKGGWVHPDDLDEPELANRKEQS
jgi:hypothetical protein